MEPEEPEAAAVTSPPKTVLPPYTPPSNEELARRKALFEKTLRLRERLGPSRVPVDKLIREDRNR